MNVVVLNDTRRDSIVWPVAVTSVSKNAEIDIGHEVDFVFCCWIHPIWKTVLLQQVASTTSLSQTCSSLLQRSRSSSSSLQQELSVDDSSDAFSSSSMSDLEGKDDDDNNDGDDDDVEDEGDKSDDIKADNDDGKESRSPTSSSAGKTNQCSNEQHGRLIISYSPSFLIPASKVTVKALRVGL